MAQSRLRSIKDNALLRKLSRLRMNEIAPMDLGAVRHVQYDNNVYSGVNIESLRRIVTRERQLSILPFANPYVLRELMLHLYDTADEGFGRSLMAVRKLFGHCIRGGTLHMLPNREMQLAQMLFNVQIGSNLEQANFEFGHHCLTTEPAQWSDYARAFLMQQRADKERMEAAFFAAYDEIAEDMKGKPEFRKLFRPQNEEEYRRGTKAFIERVGTELAKEYSVTTDVLADMLHDELRGMSSAEPARLKRVLAETIVDQTAKQCSQVQPPTEREERIVFFLDVFSMPLEFEYQSRVATAADGRKKINDVDDTFILYACCRHPESTEPPAVLITMDEDVLRVANSVDSGKVLHFNEYVSLLGLADLQVKRRLK